MNREISDYIQMLQRKYFCKDLKFVFTDIDDEQIAKRQFDEEDLNFENEQAEHLIDGFFELPRFYEEAVNLPATGTKFIRSHVEFYCGDLAQVTAEIGYWRLKPHDLKHKDYVVTKKKHITLAFWKEENRWALLNPDDWNKRKHELDEDLSHPALRQMEIEFYDKLLLAAESRESYFTKHLQSDAEWLIEDLKKLKWYAKNVPMLWGAFKLYNKKMYKKTMDRVNFVYDELFDKANTYITGENDNEGYLEVVPETHALDDALIPILFNGYEIVDDEVYSNIFRMYSERQQTNTFANLETLNDYKDTALKIYNDRIEKDMDADTFVQLQDVKTTLLQKKKSEYDKN